MANHVHGEVEFEAEGRTYVFRLGVNEMIAVQDALGLAADDERFMQALQEIQGFRKVRTMFYEGLRGAQPDMTEIAAGDLMTAMGLQDVIKVILAGMRWAMPGKEAAEDRKGGRSRPSRGPTSS